MSAEAPPAAPAWLRQLERLINKILAQDEETLEALAGLRGKVIGLEFSQTRLRFFLLPGAWGIRIQTDLEAGPDVWIKGTPANFLKLLRAARAEAPGLPADLQIMGDIALAQRFQAILRALDLDLGQARRGYAGRSDQPPRERRQALFERQRPLARA